MIHYQYHLTTSIFLNKNGKMKKLLPFSISLILVSGCSNGISPQEKRNNFDACIIEETAMAWKKIIEQERDGNTDVEWGDLQEGSIPSLVNNLCVKYLK